jgi:ATP-dependent helicase YprA (DUF1998 family)
MSDPHDLSPYIGDESELAHPHRGTGLPDAPGDSALPPYMRPDFQPSIFLYDNYPGGIGLSPQLYELHQEILQKARELIESCSCHHGCPSCVGATHEVGKGAKAATVSILQKLLGLIP